MMLPGRCTYAGGAHVRREGAAGADRPGKAAQPQAAATTIRAQRPSRRANFAKPRCRSARAAMASASPRRLAALDNKGHGTGTASAEKGVAESEAAAVPELCLGSALRPLMSLRGLAVGLPGPRALLRVKNNARSADKTT